MFDLRRGRDRKRDEEPLRSIIEPSSETDADLRFRFHKFIDRTRAI